MKNILVLTDFSAKAAYAAEFAFYLSQITSANISITHIVEAIHPASEDKTAYNLIEKETDDIINENMIQLNEIELNMNKLLPIKGLNFELPIEIKKIVRFGTLAHEVKELIKENAIDMVIIGTRKSNSISRFILGSKTHQLLDKIECPILLIPESLKFKGIQNITYATDLPLNNQKALQFLGNFAHYFNATVTVNHLSKDSSLIKKTEKEIKKSLNHQLGTNYKPFLYYTLKGKHVIEGLLETLGDNKVDILVMVHKKYEQLQGLLHISLSKKMADKSFVPLLILPNTYVSEDDIFTDDQLDHFCFGTTDHL